MNSKKKAHPTRSFEQMMSQAQLKALQPFIRQLVAQQFQQATQGIYQFIMNERSMMQTRQLAFERLLKAYTPWFTDEVLALTVAEVEDEAASLKATDTPAQEGDKVRLELWAKKDGDEKWEQEKGSKLVIHSLNTKGPGGNVQTQAELELAVIGLKVGDTKEFLISNPANEDGTVDSTRVKVTIARVSRGEPEPTPAANPNLQSQPAEANSEAATNG